MRGLLTGKWRLVGAAVLIGTAALAAFGTAREPESDGNRSFGDAAKEKTTLKATSGQEFRLREGSKLVDEIGEFRRAGADRFAFYPKDRDVSFRTLENLALERVARVLDEDTSPRLWSVSGLVTEFRGSNYLFVTRAVLNAKNAAGVDGPSLSK